ncbi:MAG: haloacid dehalogenase type II [Woeseiaceae bacterium]|nr:haloacid dehalogenase type II [Woeseiaceae bacterium]
MAITLAFDVYGTLIDPFGISIELEKLAGQKAQAMAQLWRDKQIEYLFRRALGRDYQPFSVCTAQALDYACAGFEVSLSAADRNRLLDKYRELPAYDDVARALDDLQKAGCRNFAFSNGEPRDLAELLEHAGLAVSLDGIVSVHDVRSFKPDPAVYRHFNDKTGASPDETWLVSGNPFDVIGGHKAGWRTAWVRRNPAVLFDPWDIEPDAVIEDIGGLLACLEQHEHGVTYSAD